MTGDGQQRGSVLETRVTRLFGVRHPIVQTGMGYVADARLTAATSAAGGLGILSSVLLDFGELERAIDDITARTDQPFGVNLRADQPDAERRIELMARTGVRVASFAMAPKRSVIERCKELGLLVVPSIGARRHAEKVAAWGADAVIVQGGEGGGHTGSVATSLLLPQVVDAVDIPVIGAGGFFDGRGLVAALAYGAEGIAMGTRFLLCRESPVAHQVKEVYLSKAVDDTVVTTEVDGWPQRVINSGPVARLERSNRLTRLARAARNAVAFQKMSGTPWPEILLEGLAMRRNQGLGWSQVVMAANAPMLYRTALLDGDAEAGVMATGQVVGLIDDLPTVAELVDRVMVQATETLQQLESHRIGGVRA